MAYTVFDKVLVASIVKCNGLDNCFRCSNLANLSNYRQMCEHVYDAYRSSQSF